jgi:sortase A
MADINENINTTSNNNITDAKKPKRRGMVCIIIGCFLLVAAAILIVYNVWDSWRADIASKDVVTTLENSQEESSTTGYIDLDGDIYVGILDIPTLNLELPVMSSWSYANLRTAPCVYTGSAIQGNLVIAAHNYPSHFGSIKDLKVDDEIEFKDFFGRTYKYKVVAVDVLGASDVELMTSSSGWDLTLFTCDLTGSARVTVRCQLTK